ncbi:MAG: hypothetical protein R2741_06285 [Methanolobus sp.]
METGVQGKTCPQKMIRRDMPVMKKITFSGVWNAMFPFWRKNAILAGKKA